MLDKRFYREEKEFLSERLTHYCFGFNEVFQFVENEGENLREIIFNLLIDPRDERHEFKSALLDGKVKYFGIARDEYQKRPLTSIILADNVEEIPQKKFADNLYDEINHLRKNPKSFIKLYEDLIESIPNACVEQKAAAYNMINFLKSSRFYGPLQRSELLNKAAES